ncbi:MAG TPA: 3-hydroxyacyl-CoA dehydrogenase family protein, partial [Candidatus Thermoplasmatota archaeon]|nr:3-hydroxyacyl-CoA dehydrogenase family protein [Candidatus Thermoplasmatota archaeon]
EAGLARVRSNLVKGVEKGKVTTAERDAVLARLRGTTDLAAAVRDADLVVEAVPERLDLKRAVFRETDAAAPRRAILATNTSSLPVSEIAACTTRPERVLGLHFFNPPHLMKLLEVVTHAGLDAAVLEAAVAFARAAGKEPIVVKDAPGFATSRLGVAIGLEAIRMLEEGVASAEDIDKAMTLGYNHPMGPLRLTDLVGLDVRLGIAEHLARTLGPRFEPPALLRQMVKEGRLGQKTGRGFYTWEASR